MPQLLYACDRENPNTMGARCRAPALENGRCADHQNGCEPFKRPTRVLVKLTIPTDLLSEGLKALAEKNNRNYRASLSNQPEGRAKIMASSESKGIDPNAYRGAGKTPDEGTLAVFWAEPGASPRTYQPPTVNMLFLLEELYQHLGMASVQGWRKMRSYNGRGFAGRIQEDSFVLQIEFSSKTNPGVVPDYYAEHDEEISHLLRQVYRVWIYESPDGPDRYDEDARYLLCTANAVYCANQGQKPDGVLHYTLADAMWAVS